MTYWTDQSMVEDPQILSKRLGEFAKRLPTKDFADRIACDIRTAENIRAGRTWPIARHWLRIWLEFGDDVIEAVFYPERVEARIKREAEARDQARRQRIASASFLAERRALGVAGGLVQFDGPASEPEALGPPNLDLFDEARP